MDVSQLSFNALVNRTTKTMFCQANMGEKTIIFLFWLQGLCVFVLADVWKVKVESEVKALVSSCVVLPCSFKYPGTLQPSSRQSGIWHKTENKWNDYIYHEDHTKIADNFRGRTRLVGSLGDLNCSLEIDQVRNHDNGPFCFRVELQTSEKDKYSFVKNCVNVKMIETAASPELHSDESVQEGHPAVFRCSVRHTCPSHQPILTWSHDGKEMVTYKDIGHGNWEVESILTFIPTKEDDHTDITCKVSYHGFHKEFKARRPVFVKEQATISHILIPVLSALGSALLVGGLCFLMVKRYKNRIEELQFRNDNIFRSGGNNSGLDERENKQVGLLIDIL